MQVLVSEASETQLAWMFLTAMGRNLDIHTDAILDGMHMPGSWVSGIYSDPNKWVRLDEVDLCQYLPDLEFVERNRIHICPVSYDGRDATQAWVAGSKDATLQYGFTCVHAVMRSFVVSRLGDTVDLPAEISMEVGRIERSTRPSGG